MGGAWGRRQEAASNIKIPTLTSESRACMYTFIDVITCYPNPNNLTRTLTNLIF